MKKIMYILISFCSLLSFASQVKSPHSLRCISLRSSVEAILEGKKKLSDIQESTLQSAAAYLVATQNNVDKALLWVMLEQWQKEKRLQALASKKPSIQNIILKPQGLESLRYYKNFDILKKDFIRCGAQKDLINVIVENIKKASSLEESLNTFVSEPEKKFGPLMAKDIVEVLLKVGANPNYITPLTRAQLTPLLRAILFAKVNNKEIIELLLRYGADPNIIHTQGMRALDYAYERRYSDIIELLKQYGARDKSSNNYWTRFKSLW